ncbi:hypothetical protein Amet_3632 [Alkaliphilus metalliredigens QYMF]|uniref:Lipoprotein n=1 Tax=Alkaliphilus metalliredigens (strain QYMF) TaxID=293826 RepID=A6TU86_ALKMQ|nr:hypothetical protein [Alkaliphilus metalliredigens]ABR49754.1 hypothetical protein Amet_3632 [Alkaliphilus metalliredigens QYMF]
MKNVKVVMICIAFSSIFLGVTACQDKQENKISEALKAELVAFVEIMDENIERNELIYQNLSKEFIEVSQVLEAFFPEDEYIESIERLFDQITILENQGQMTKETEKIILQAYFMYQVGSIHQQKIIEKTLKKVTERQGKTRGLGYSVSIPTTHLKQYHLVEKELEDIQKKSIQEVVEYYEEIKGGLRMQLGN